MEIVGKIKLCGNRRISAQFKWKSYEVREESLRFLTEPLRYPYDRTIIVRSPYDTRTTCLRATVWTYDFNADYFKIVEATEIVGSRRIVGTS